MLKIASLLRMQQCVYVPLYLSICTTTSGTARIFLSHSTFVSLFCLWQLWLISPLTPFLYHVRRYTHSVSLFFAFLFPSQFYLQVSLSPSLCVSESVLLFSFTFTLPSFWPTEYSQLFLHSPTFYYFCSVFLFLYFQFVVSVSVSHRCHIMILWVQVRHQQLLEHLLSSTPQECLSSSSMPTLMHYKSRYFTLIICFQLCKSSLFVHSCSTVPTLPSFPPPLFSKRNSISIWLHYKHKCGCNYFSG